MNILFGILGAITGAIVGLISAFFASCEITRGDDIGGVFLFLMLAPLGLLLGSPLGGLAGLRVIKYLRRNDSDGTLRRRKAALVVCLVVGIPALMWGMTWASVRTNEPTQDRELLANFASHQATFDKIILMEQKDRKLTRVDEDWTIPDDPRKIGVPAARIAEYRRLLKSANTPRGFQATDDGSEVDFFYWLTGSAISSDTDKGYAYLTKPPAHVLNSLDRCRPDEKHGVKAYRHIQGNWYLFYDYLPG